MGNYEGKKKRECKEMRGRGTNGKDRSDRDGKEDKCRIIEWR